MIPENQSTLQLKSNGLIITVRTAMPSEYLSDLIKGLSLGVKWGLEGEDVTQEERRALLALHSLLWQFCPCARQLEQSVPA